MRILREWLGGSQEYDLDDPDEYFAFVHGVVQDEEVAESMIDEILDLGCITINEFEPELIERYTLLLA